MKPDKDLIKVLHPYLKILDPTTDKLLTLLEKRLDKREYPYTLSNLVERRIFHVILKSIDQDSADRLKKLDALENKMTKKLMRKTGWIVDQEVAYNDSDYLAYWEGEELASFGDIYYLDRTLYGYSPDEHEVSQAFYQKHKKELEELHMIFSEKEKILLRSCTPVSEIAEHAIPFLAAYLGYYNYNYSLEDTKTLKKIIETKE